jgi:hypothetical protein
MALLLFPVETATILVRSLLGGCTRQLYQRSRHHG